MKLRPLYCTLINLRHLGTRPTVYSLSPGHCCLGILCLVTIWTPMYWEWEYPHSEGRQSCYTLLPLRHVYISQNWPILSTTPLQRRPWNPCFVDEENRGSKTLWIPHSKWRFGLNFVASWPQSLCLLSLCWNLCFGKDVFRGKKQL